MTAGYIETGRGELLISYVQSFATAEAFAKAHPDVSVEVWKKVQPKKVVKPSEDTEKK
jgi:uncharacterized protein YjhX (UPF0386 family)